MINKCTVIIILVCCLAIADSVYGDELSLPEIQPRRLQAIGRLSFKPIKESSGLIRSRARPEMYWTHNDSGNEARIFAVRMDGSIVKPENTKDKEYDGIRVSGTENIDWEDIALDAEGNLYIGDFGNNWNTRRDLSVLVLKEPDPFSQTDVRVRRLPFEFPDQTAYPPPPKQRNFDAEALFFANDRLYILTKNRGNKHTKLYRFETLLPGRVNRLLFLGEFDTREMVTAADISPDGNRLVVLTYDAVWMFERTDSDPESWLNGKVWWHPIKNCNTCEGVCFSDDAILISSEDRALFSVNIADLVKVRE